MVLRSKHVHVLGAHKDRAQMTHVLRFTSDVLGDPEDDPVWHDLILLLLRLLEHHLMGGGLLRLPELILLIHDVCCGAKGLD